MLTIRPLRPWDALFCWRLANEGSPWRHYTEKKPPTVLGHVRWMWAWLCKRDRKAWVVMDGFHSYSGGGLRAGGGYQPRLVAIHQRAGLVRVERRGHRTVMSVAILPIFRSRGIAQKALTIASRWAIGQGWGIPTAYIMAGNIASVMAFRGAGFEIANQNDGWVTMELRA